MRFYEKAAAFEVVANLPSPRSELVEAVVEILQEHQELRRPFFQGLQNPVWADRFYERGLLTDNRLLEENLLFLLTLYLSEVADKVPEVVAGCVDSLETADEGVLGNLARALARVPPALAQQCSGSVAGWIRQLDSLQTLQEHIFVFLDCLVHQGGIKHVLGVLRELLTVRPPTDVESRPISLISLRFKYNQQLDSSNHLNTIISEIVEKVSITRVIPPPPSPG